MNNLLNIKFFLKFLSRNKVYTLINVFGLSLSLMFVILITVYVKQELSVDKFQENAEQIYMLGNEEGIGSAFRLAYRIKDRYPEIEKVCPLVPTWYKQPVTVNDVKHNADVLFADSTFFNMFSFPLVEGTKEGVLQSRDYAVVSESFVRKVFPNVDPIGKTIFLNDSVNVTVSGIMKDIKNSSIPYADVLIRIDNIKFFNSSMDSEHFNNAGSCVVFIQKRKEADLNAKAEDMKSFFKEIFWLYKNGLCDQVRFVPLKEFYFSDYESPGLMQGDKSFVLILLSVGILILVFAIINYINLTVAQAGFRAKEMSIRRLNGASRGELFMRLIMESTLVTFISFFIGLLLAMAVVPFANDLLQTKILIGESLSTGAVLLSLGLILVIGALSGILPAYIISNSKPIDVVRGEFRQKTKMRFSKVFITFQNVITIVMIAASITMIMQVDHLIKAPLGYQSTNLMDIPLFESKEKLVTLGNELQKLSSVKRVAYSQGTPFSRGNNHTMQYKEKNKNISFQSIVSDQTFFDMLGLQIIRDNHYTGTGGFYLSEQALRELEISEDAETFTFYDNKPSIAGILKDFQLYNITYRVAPILYRINKLEDFYPWDLIVEVQGDPFVANKDIKAVYEKFTGLEFNGEYFDEQIQKSFEAQQRTSKIVMLFAIIAIIISLLGLVAMSTYFILQRSREIAVRKVFGSSSMQILKRLVLTFLNYVLIAFVIASPIIWYAMNKWLSDYDYRIELSPLIFIGAGLFCLLISFVAVVVQSYYAANGNPVKRLKAE
ncbi:ABC transporter permease [Massilibacteroides sp.]|uniref:ABC transporter permease n=1 Tax=Massilibacteroides sp. TaxID=2034766 RepID=UPI0026048FD0|nr:ABC transporter permease [Massilibacteroides sp.]MDD4514293.1 ABC transporter permease [Massilibacteroides sp.]